MLGVASIITRVKRTPVFVDVSKQHMHIIYERSLFVYVHVLHQCRAI